MKTRITLFAGLALVLLPTANAQDTRVDTFCRKDESKQDCTKRLLRRNTVEFLGYTSGRAKRGEAVITTAFIYDKNGDRHYAHMRCGRIRENGYIYFGEYGLPPGGESHWYHWVQDEEFHNMENVIHVHPHPNERYLTFCKVDDID
jgi:hypothetical protein